MSAYHVKTTINGDPVEFVCEAEEALLDVLRDRLGLTGAKEGCGTGDCGACSIMLDDRLVCSCLVLGPEAQGRRIETIEGMAPHGNLHPFNASSLSTPPSNAASARRGFSSPHVRFWKRTPIRARPKSVIGLPAISAGARDMTRLSAR